VIYTLKLNTAEMDTFLDIFVAGLNPNSAEASGPKADLLNKVSAMGREYENDRMAGVK
jgi:hypothetical protein